MATKQQDLETVLAAVEAVQSKETQEGQRFWLVTGGGQRYYCWGSSLASGLQGGGPRELAYRPGKFPRLRKARPVATSNGSGQADAEEHNDASPNIGTAVQASSQERLEALRVVLTLAQWTRLESVDQALAAAEKVLQWLKGSEGGQG